MGVKSERALYCSCWECAVHCFLGKLPRTTTGECTTLQCPAAGTGRMNGWMHGMTAYLSGLLSV